IKNVAAPINARRHHLKHGMEMPPCGITGFCNDCRPPQRGCAYTVIVECQRIPRITVALVGENLGI
ncbi:MAG: lactate utilization protein, partial [Chloroflexota bacterium]|nr:lactate utilization protein [Chloroflexota bacterium]